MFEKILIGPYQNITEGASDPGALAEAIIFYKNVNLVVNFGDLVELIKFMGPEVFIKMIHETNVNLNIIKHPSVVHTGPLFHSFLHMEIRGNSEYEVRNEYDILVFAFHRVTNDFAKAKNHAKDVKEKINFFEIEKEFYKNFGIGKISIEILEDKNFLKRAIPDIIKIIAPDYNLEWGKNLSGISTQKGILVSSDIDFEKINLCHKRQYPNSDREFNKALLLHNISEFSINQLLTIKYNIPIVTNAIQKCLFQNKLLTINSYQTNNMDNIKAFSEMVLSGKSIREVINKRERDFNDVITLYKQSIKYKNWLGDLPDESNLLNEYIKEITNEGWANSIPGKSIRCLIGNIIGQVPMAGIVYSAFDSLLIGQKWNPKIFVQGPFKEFSSGDYHYNF